jgi:hypothetical protein
MHLHDLDVLSLFVYELLDETRFISLVNSMSAVGQQLCAAEHLQDRLPLSSQLE